LKNPPQGANNSTEDGVSAAEFRNFASEITKWIAQVEGLKAQEKKKVPSDSDSTSSNSKRRHRRKKKEKKRGRKGKKSTRKSKGRRRKRSPTPSSGSSSSVSSNSSSDSSKASSASGSSQGSLPKLLDRDRHSKRKEGWYAVIRGKGGCCGLYCRKKEAEALRTSGTLIRSFHAEEKAWDWFNSVQTQSKVQTLAEQETVDGPSAPRISLSGKDPSTGKDDEVFGIKVDVSTNELMAKFSPPGVDTITSGQLNEAMVDATAIPGKAFGSTEAEEAQDVMGHSLAALAGITRADDGGDLRLDLRWHSPTRTALRAVKDLKDLLELQHDAQSVSNNAIKRTMVSQRSLLLKLRWSETTIEAWTYGGYITTISQRSVAAYLELIQHLIQMEADGSWSLAQQELDCYIKELHLLRTNAGSRIQCMISIYIFQ